MVTTVTTVTAATAGLPPDQFGRQAASDATPALSAIAEQALAGVARMQAEFTSAQPVAASAPVDVALVPAPKAPTESPSAAGIAADDAAMMREMSVAIVNSTQVQAQLAQFMITASISTTMGSNLNTFLKGQ